MDFKALIAVFFGGGLGAASRFLLSRFWSQHWANYLATHWATFTINILASGALVLFLRQYADRPVWLLFLTTGVCGGFSTFSTFSLETAQLLQSGRTLEAATYVVLSVVLGAAVSFVLLQQYR